MDAITYENKMSFTIYDIEIQGFFFMSFKFCSSLLKGSVTNILEENVLQPLLVSTSAINLAAETVRSILKIDDIISIKQFSKLINHARN